MAKYEEVFEDTQTLFTEMIDKSGLNSINITVLANNKAKELFKINKANDLLKYRTDDDIIIVINEKIFEKFSDEQKMIIVEEAIANIHFDFDKDKVVITPPDFVAHTGILRKYGFEKIDVIRETTHLLFESEREAEEERKAASKVK